MEAITERGTNGEHPEEADQAHRASPARHAAG